MKTKILVPSLILSIILGITMLSGCGVTRKAGYHYPTKTSQASESKPAVQTTKASNSDNALAQAKTTKTKYSSPVAKTNADSDTTTPPVNDIKKFVGAFVEKTLQLFMRYSTEYRDVNLGSIKINGKGNVSVECDSKGMLRVYNPVMSISTGRAIIREIVNFETSSIRAQIPQFWSQTLTEMVIQEITPDTNAYSNRENAGLCQELMQFFGQQSKKTREQVYQIMLTYFLRQDGTGLREYVDSCAGIKIFDDMTTDYNQNVKILYNRLN